MLGPNKKAMLGPEKKESSPLVEPALGRLRESPTGELDPGGDLPLFSPRIVSIFVCQALSWCCRASVFSFRLSIFQAYLDAPANVIAAGSAIIVFGPQLFVLIPGILSDCVPLCGSRRRAYAIIGGIIGIIGYAVILLSHFPAPYRCHGRNSDVCNEDAPREAGALIAKLFFVQIGTVSVETALGGLVLDLARREPIASRGRTVTCSVVANLTGAAIGWLLIGILLNGVDYGGDSVFTIGFKGACTLLMLLQMLMLTLIMFHMYEPPINKGATCDDAAESLHQTANTLRTPFLVRVLTYQLLADTATHVTPPYTAPIFFVWCHVTPLTASLTSFLACMSFAGVSFVLMDRLPHWSWRLIVVVTVCTAAFIHVVTLVIVTEDISRSPIFALASAFLASENGGIVNFARMLVSNYVVTEVTSGANQATLGSLFLTVHALGPLIGRAVAGPLWGYQQPSMAAMSSYEEDTAEFHEVVLAAGMVAAVISCTIVTFVCLLPDSKHESREGVRTSIRRPNLLYIVVFVVAILVLAAGFMCVAPLFPDLACDPLLGGDGSCDEPDHFNAPSNSTEEKTPINYERARERVPVMGAGGMDFAERDRLNPSRVMGW